MTDDQFKDKYKNYSVSSVSSDINNFIYSGKIAFKLKIMQKIKQEYLDKLNELDVYDKFMTNLKSSIRKHENIDGVIKEINGSPSFSIFLSGSFDFEESPEGKDFWTKISKS